MRIKLLSDLHLEFCDFTIPYDDEDVLILAGDMSPDSNEALSVIKQYMETNSKPEVILVLGNHDFYYSNMQNVLDFWKSVVDDEVFSDRVHFLERDSVVIQGIRFYGATLWTDLHRGSVKQYTTL